MIASYGPIIFVPGTIGSRLKQGSTVVWGDVRTPFGDFDRLKLPGPSTQADQVIESVAVVPGYAKVFYGSILGYLRSNLGYSDNINLFLFPYDWRQDCAENAAKLKSFIRHRKWAAQNVEFTILAHSMGGLIARYYVQVLGSDSLVRSVIVMGTPHLGTPDAFETLMKGAKVLPPTRIRQNATLAVVRTFPSVYQLLPTDGRYMRDHQNNAVYLRDPRNHDWLEPQEQPLMKRALKSSSASSTYGMTRATNQFLSKRGQPGHEYVRFCL